MNELVTEIVRGARDIEKHERLLLELAQNSGQPEVLADMHYFLGKPGLLNRTPVLLLFRPVDNSAPVGALLLFEYKVAGFSLGMYTSNDRSGRRTVIAPARCRWEIAAEGAEVLLRRGAHLVMMSFRGDAGWGEQDRQERHRLDRSSWVFRSRETPDYLPLGSTYDETLARIGKRTRTHMRYYRRRAEEQLGCSFVPDLKLSREDLLAFKKRCMYAVPDEVASWRLQAVGKFERPVLMGLRDRDGELLSLLGGRRLGTDTEVFWQLNRCDLAQHSLSLVMRTYLIEHEISQGMERVFLDGGSAHSLCHAFVTGKVVDLSAVRHTPVSFAVRKLARLMIPWDNELAHLLVDPAHSSRTPALAVD